MNVLDMLPPAMPVAAEEERNLTLLQLVANYRPLILKEVTRVMRQARDIDADLASTKDDLLGTALLIAAETFPKWDPDRAPRFGALYRRNLVGENGLRMVLVRQRAVEVSPYQARIHAQLIMTHQRDLDAARSAAPAAGMSEETFDAVTRALSGGPALASIDEPAYEHVSSDTALDAQRALRVLDQDERRVITLVYGLQGDAPKSGRLVAEALGLPPRKVRTLRESAMLKMQAQFNDKE